MTWKDLPGLAKDIAIGADGTAWVIGTNAAYGGFTIHRWDGGNWPAVDGGAVRIAVAPDGHPWVVNDANEIYERVGNVWKIRPGSAKDISVGADGSVWVVGTNPMNGGFGIYRWNGRDWDAIDGGGVRIAVTQHGMPWVVNDAGAIYRRIPGLPGRPAHWELVPNRTATDIAMGPGDTVWVTGTDTVQDGHSLYWTDDGSGRWSQIDGGAVAIAADNRNEPWIVTDRGIIREGLDYTPF